MDLTSLFRHCFIWMQLLDSVTQYRAQKKARIDSASGFPCTLRHVLKPRRCNHRGYCQAVSRLTARSSQIHRRKLPHGQWHTSSSISQLSSLKEGSVMSPSSTSSHPISRLIKCMKASLHRRWSFHLHLCPLLRVLCSSSLSGRLSLEKRIRWKIAEKGSKCQLLPPFGCITFQVLAFSWLVFFTVFALVFSTFLTSVTSWSPSLDHQASAPQYWLDHLHPCPSPYAQQQRVLVQPEPIKNSGCHQCITGYLPPSGWKHPDILWQVPSLAELTSLCLCSGLRFNQQNSMKTAHGDLIDTSARWRSIKCLILPSSSCIHGLLPDLVLLIKFSSCLQHFLPPRKL